MVICPVVIPAAPLRFVPLRGGDSNTIEVVYRSGQHEMRLEFLDSRPGRYNTAQRTLRRHGMDWVAHRWRHQDGGPWNYMKER